MTPETAPTSVAVASRSIVRKVIALLRKIAESAPARAAAKISPELYKATLRDLSARLADGERMPIEEFGKALGISPEVFTELFWLFFWVYGEDEFGLTLAVPPRAHGTLQ